MLNALPLSANGKVDRNALPAPESSLEKASMPVAQQSDVEQTIACVWQKVLGIKQIGRSDNFFDAGGDSLQLLEAHAELQKLISSDLLITDLFEHSTVMGLAQFINGKKSSSGIRDAQERARRQQRAWAQQKPSRVNQTS
jgi:acyl carrier protein